MSLEEKANKLADLCHDLNNVKCSFCPMQPCPIEASDHVDGLNEERVKIIEECYDKMFDSEGNVKEDVLPETDITKMSDVQLLDSYANFILKDKESAREEILKRMRG